MQHVALRRKTTGVAVHGVQWTGRNRAEVTDFVARGHGAVRFGDVVLLSLWVKGADDWVPVPEGYVIIQDYPGYFHPIRGTELGEKYEAID